MDPVELKDFSDVACYKFHKDCGCDTLDYFATEEEYERAMRLAFEAGARAALDRTARWVEDIKPGNRHVSLDAAYKGLILAQLMEKYDDAFGD